MRFDYYQNDQKMSKFLLPKGGVSVIFVREIDLNMIKDSQALITQKESWEDYYLLSLKSPAIARQTKRVWEQQGFASQDTKMGKVIYCSTLDPARLAFVAKQLINLHGSSMKARWDGMALYAEED